MDEKQYKAFYEKVGKLIGWDFSQVKTEKEGEKWDFLEEVLKISNPDSILLDIGTGGGEKVLEIADKFLFVIGIDHSKSMIKTANRNLSKSSNKNVTFVLMDSKELIFEDAFFDVVLSRHCDFYPKEVFRVLKPEGYFLTQQVSEGDKLNIKKAFNRGQAFGKKDGALKNRYLNELKQAGFKNIKADEYDAKEYFKSLESLIFVLKSTPTIPNFGKNPKDFQLFEEFVSGNSSSKGICTNSKRFMITARK